MTLQPAEAYGERDEARMQRIPAKHFADAKHLKPGQPITLETRRGPVQASVKKVGRSTSISTRITHWRDKS